MNKELIQFYIFNIIIIHESKNNNYIFEILNY